MSNVATTTVLVEQIMRNAGIQYANLIIYLRYFVPNHPQRRYLETMYTSEAMSLEYYHDECSLLSQVADEFEGVPHADMHVYPCNNQVSVSCFGVKDRDLPAIKQGTMVLVVFSPDSIRRSWIHGRLRSESRPRELVEALFV